MRPYLLGSSFNGCNYVRVWMPAWANGFQTDRRSLTSKRDDVKLISQEIQGADVVVFHRPETEEAHILADMCKKDGKKIVMDNDDTFYIDDNHPLAELSPEGESTSLLKRIDSINEFIKKSDLVTCSTEFLAKEYRRLTDNVVVLPNCIDPDDWDTPERNESDVVRIGIVGSVAFEYDYLHLKDVIRQLSDRKDVQIVMFGLGDKKHRQDNPLVTKVFKEEYAFWDSVNYEHFPWCDIADYPARLNEARLDFMLIPRKDNYFNRCKSNLKFLEASMCEIPVIAQSFEDGPYEGIPNGCGALITDNKYWLETIDYFIKNKDVRRGVGKNAKEYVLKHYNIHNNASRWEAEYQKLCK